MLTRKYRILLPLADGALTGLCCYLAAALLLSQFFPVSPPSFYLLTAVTAVVSAIHLQVSSDTDGLLILLFWGFVLPFAALVRLMLVLIRRNPS